MPGPPAPEAFAHLVNLAADALGTFVLYATDDYFAEKENLVRPDAPVFRPEAYTDRGKWMDGWESQRRREAGHDFAVLRLGAPGRVHGVLCDTTHFKGNAPAAVSLEVCHMPATATVGELLALPVVEDAAAAAELGGRAWHVALPRVDVRADHPNVLALPCFSAPATHARLRIFPDGGVARLRIYGEVEAPPRTFWQPAAVDLAAVENGGTIAAVSDAFFGPPSNLLLPGRGVNMGDGWETRRRRTPGSDWCVIRLARRAVVQRVEIDTHFFKGNAPQAARIEHLDEGELGAEAVRALLADPSGWGELIEATPLVQHRRHLLEPARPLVATHLRVHMYPHGGINRLRVYGHAVDTPAEAARLAALNAAPPEEARALLASFNGAPAFAEALLARRPFASVRALFAAADEVWWALTEADHLAAFAAHPRIGASHRAATATARSANWSAAEQAQVRDAGADTRARLAALNDAYFERFGFIFICFASGRTAEQMLALLEQRIENRREQEIENAAREQARITRLRVEKWLLDRAGA